MNLPWFSFGMFLGYFGMWITKRVVDSKTDSPTGVIKKFFNTKIDESEEFTEAFKVEDLNNDYITLVSEYDGKDTVEEGSFKSEGSDRKSTNHSGSNADREHVSKLLQNTEYESVSEADATVEGKLCLVSNDSEYSLADVESSEDDTDEYVVQISAVVFVKAVTQGLMMKSFVFNPFNKKFYWNFTNSELTEEEADNLFGKHNVEEIIDESNYNANGWIQPRYYQDLRDNVFIKVETGVNF